MSPDVPAGPPASQGPAHAHLVAAQVLGRQQRLSGREEQRQTWVSVAATEPPSLQRACVPAREGHSPWLKCCDGEFCVRREGLGCLGGWKYCFQVRLCESRV